MSTTKQKERDFERWPSYKKAYLKSFEKMIEERIRQGLKTELKTAEEVMDWWIYGKRKNKEGEMKEITIKFSGTFTAEIDEEEIAEK